MPPPDSQSTDMEAFQRALSKSKHIIAVAGAGLSAASEAPGVIGENLTQHDSLLPELFAMILPAFGNFITTGVKSNPIRYDFHLNRARVASPNAAHYALSMLSIPNFRNALAPESTFTLITQNVDGLSSRALETTLKGLPETEREAAAASQQEQPHILEMHGRLFEVRCTSNSCGHTEWNDDSPICAALAGTEELVDANVIEPTIPESDLPKCKKCGALARPGVVWFGEQPLYLDIIDELVEKADMCLVVGTSSTVYPAAGYAAQVRQHGGEVAVFNLERGQGDDRADYLFLGPCEETLPKALGLDTKESDTQREEV